MKRPKCESHAGAVPEGGTPERPHLPRSPGQWAVFVGVALLLAALIGAIIWQSSGRGGEPTEQEMEEVVVTCGDFTLTNTELNYYYWSEYFYLVGSYGDYLPDSLDTAKPLDEQPYDETRTWQEYILEQALDTVRSTQSMVFEAEAAGFALPESYQQSLGGVLRNFEGYAEASGFLDETGAPDVQAYLADSYGPGASVESFTSYLHDSYLAAAYSDELFYSPTFTDREISDYYDLFAGDYAADGVPKDDTRLRSIRMVLLQPAADGQDAWDEARASAETLYATWQAESGSEDDFAAMAAAHSADPSSAEGGLLENLSPADLTGELAAWTFDGARQPGDTAVLRSDEGWTVAYYVETSDRTLWQQTAEADLRRQTYQDAFRALSDRYSFEIDEARMQIATPSGLYSGAAGAAESLPAGD